MRKKYKNIILEKYQPLFEETTPREAFDLVKSLDSSFPDEVDSSTVKKYRRIFSKKFHPDTGYSGDDLKNINSALDILEKNAGYYGDKFKTHPDSWYAQYAKFFSEDDTIYEEKDFYTQQFLWFGKKLPSGKQTMEIELFNKDEGIFECDSKKYKERGSKLNGKTCYYPLFELSDPYNDWQYYAYDWVENKFNCYLIEATIIGESPNNNTYIVKDKKFIKPLDFTDVYDPLTEELLYTTSHDYSEYEDPYKPWVFKPYNEIGAFIDEEAKKIGITVVDVNTTNAHSFIYIILKNNDDLKTLEKHFQKVFNNRYLKNKDKMKRFYNNFNNADLDFSISAYPSENNKKRLPGLDIRYNIIKTKTKDFLKTVKIKKKYTGKDVSDAILNKKIKEGTEVMIELDGNMYFSNPALDDIYYITGSLTYGGKKNAMYIVLHSINNNIRAFKKDVENMYWNSMYVIIGDETQKTKNWLDFIVSISIIN